MSRYDDEFNKVKKGLPEENTQQKARLNYLLIFTIVGVVFALVILIFQDTISTVGINLSQNGRVPEQIIINGILALLVGSIQAWIFKARIKARGYIFVGFSLMGGVIAGLIGGLLINSGVNEPIVIGLVTGAIAGGFSSLSQNKVMGNNKYGTNWFIYSAISWAIIFAIGWTIGWNTADAIKLATSGGFLVIASGVSLAIFLNNTPQIEFS